MRQMPTIPSYGNNPPRYRLLVSNLRIVGVNASSALILRDERPLSLSVVEHARLMYEFTVTGPGYYYWPEYAPFHTFAETWNFTDKIHVTFENITLAVPFLWDTWLNSNAIVTPWNRAKTTFRNVRMLQRCWIRKDGRAWWPAAKAFVGTGVFHLSVYRNAFLERPLEVFEKNFEPGAGSGGVAMAPVLTKNFQPPFSETAVLPEATMRAEFTLVLEGELRVQCLPEAASCQKGAGEAPGPMTAHLAAHGVTPGLGLWSAPEDEPKGGDPALEWMMRNVPPTGLTPKPCDVPGAEALPPCAGDASAFTTTIKHTVAGLPCASWGDEGSTACRLTEGAAFAWCFTEEEVGSGGTGFGTESPGRRRAWQFCNTWLCPVPPRLIPILQWEMAPADMRPGGLTLEKHSHATAGGQETITIIASVTVAAAVAGMAAAFWQWRRLRWSMRGKKAVGANHSASDSAALKNGVLALMDGQQLYIDSVLGYGAHGVTYTGAWRDTTVAVKELTNVSGMA